MDLNPLDDKMTSQELPEAARQNGGLVRAALIDLMEVEPEALNGKFIENGTFDFAKQSHYRALFARARAALAATAQCAAPDERSFQCGDLRAEIMAIKWVEPEDIDETAIDDMELTTHREGFEAFRKAAIALIAAQPVAAQSVPFMFAIMGPDGKPYFDEHCVAPTPEALYSIVNALNDSPDAGYAVVPVYIAPPPAPVAVPALSALADRMYEALPACPMDVPDDTQELWTIYGELRAMLAAPSAPVGDA